MGKKTFKKHSMEEVRVRMDAYIDASAKRLRTRLRQAWKKQLPNASMSRHEIVV